MAAVQVSEKPVEESLWVAVSTTEVATVQETRVMVVGEGGDVLLDNLPDAIDRFQLHCPAHPTLHAATLRFEQPTKTSDALLSQLVGRSFEFSTTNEAFEVNHWTRGTLLLAGTRELGSSSVVVQIEGQHEAVKVPHVVAFRCDAAEVHRQARMLATLTAEPASVCQPGCRIPLEATYTTAGLKWSVQYGCVLSADQKSIDIDGTILLENTSGKHFQQAHVCVLAGAADIQAFKRPRKAKMLRRESSGSMASTSSSVFLSKTKVPVRHHDETQPYELVLGRTFDIPSGSVVRHVFWSASLPAEILHFYCPNAYSSQEPLKEPLLDKAPIPTNGTLVNRVLAFKHQPAPAPPLSSGPLSLLVRRENAGVRTFARGAFQMPATEPGESVKLIVGTDEDLIGEHRRVDFRLDRHEHVMIETFAVTIKSLQDRDETTSVVVQEVLPRWNVWQIENVLLDGKPLAFNQTASNAVQFVVEVAGQTTRQLTFAVTYTKWLNPGETAVVTETPTETPATPETALAAASETKPTTEPAAAAQPSPTTTTTAAPKKKRWFS